MVAKYLDRKISKAKDKVDDDNAVVQKACPICEKCVAPKRKSLADYTQDDMTLSMNHINSTARASLNGRNPYELARLLLKEDSFYNHILRKKL